MLLGSIQSLPKLLPLSKAATSFQQAKSLSWDVMVAKNEVLNRAFIEVFGYYAWQQLFARNRYERIEETLDTASHLALGTLAPIGINAYVAKKWLRPLQNKFAQHFISKNVHPLNTPLELLDTALLKSPKLNPFTSKQLTENGLKNLSPQLIKTLSKVKLGFMATDLLLLASSQQLYAWGKNALTEKLSGKKGFVGIFNQASESYVDQQQQQYQKSEKKRFWASMAIGFGGNMLLPLMLFKALKSPVQTGHKSMMGIFKKAVPLFNYNNLVYQSKYVLLWSTLMNDTVATALSSRDKNEMREALSKYAVINFFYFLGDDFISKGLAHFYEKKYAKTLGGKKLTETGSLTGIKWAKGLDELIQPATTSQQKLINTLGRKIFWSGLIGTSLCLGIGLTLASNWNTKRYVQKDQEKLAKTRNKPTTFSAAQSWPTFKPNYSYY